MELDPTTRLNRWVKSAEAKTVHSGRLAIGPRLILSFVFIILFDVSRGCHYPLAILCSPYTGNAPERNRPRASRKLAPEEIVASGLSSTRPESVVRARLCSKGKQRIYVDVSSLRFSNRKFPGLNAGSHDGTPYLHCVALFAAAGLCEAIGS